MTSNRPYLIRAIHEWITDNDEVPFIIVNLMHPECVAPPGYEDEETITYNLSFEAVNQLVLDNEYISFSARFKGKLYTISFPPEAVMGIYSRDTGQGMMFEPVGNNDDTEPEEKPVKRKKIKKKPSLSLVTNPRKKDRDQ